MPDEITEATAPSTLTTEGEPAQDYIEAIATLRGIINRHGTPIMDGMFRLDALTPVGLAWIGRMEGHLSRRLERYLRERLPVTSEAMAQALLRDAGANLRRASEALKVAAAELKNRGAGLLANRTIQAARETLEAAQACGD